MEFSVIGAKEMEHSQGQITGIGGDSLGAAPKPVGSPSIGHTLMIISATRAARPVKKFR
jgi:hypothetical protein